MERSDREKAGQFTEQSQANNENPSYVNFESLWDVLGRDSLIFSIQYLWHKLLTATLIAIEFIIKLPKRSFKSMQMIANYVEELCKDRTEESQTSQNTDEKQSIRRNHGLAALLASQSNSSEKGSHGQTKLKEYYYDGLFNLNEALDKLSENNPEDEGASSSYSSKST